MIRGFLSLVFLLSLLAGVGAAQHRTDCTSYYKATAQCGISFKGDEYVAGLGLNLLSRGPWVDSSFRKPLPRFLMTQTISFGYEYFLDYHGWDFIDFSQRLQGYLITELGIYAVPKLPIETNVADFMLWEDYSQMRYGYINNLGTTVLGVGPLTPLTMTLVNGSELVINTWPTKYRSYINVATILFHIPYFISNMTKRRQGLVIGFHLWPIF